MPPRKKASASTALIASASDAKTSSTATAVADRYAIAEDADEVLGKCRSLRKSMKESQRKHNLRVMAKAKNEEKGTGRGKSASPGDSLARLDTGDHDDSSNDDSNDESGSSLEGQDKKRSAGNDETALVAMGSKKLRVEDLADFQTKWKDVVEVNEMNPIQVIEGIEQEAVRVARSILAQQAFSYDIPSRSNTNQIYVPELDRYVSFYFCSCSPFCCLSFL
jgi:hypothetical protein